MVGGAGEDSFTAAGGADTLDGGAGDDNMSGGAGVDTALYGGPRNHYTIAQDGTGGYFVIDNFASEGADHVVDVENLQFTDQVFVPTPFNTGVIKDGHITNDSLVGSTGPDLLRGFGGDDTLAGGGGADQLLGGAGDDALHIPDLSFASAVGGAGSDRLVVDGAALTLSLAGLLPTRLQGIGAIDLGASANNRLVLSRQNLLDLSDSDVLTVDGVAGDRVSLADAGWVNGAVAGGYAVFTNGAATLRVASGITVDTTLAIAATSAVRAEGNSGATSFTSTVTRAGGVAGVNTVRWW